MFDDGRTDAGRVRHSRQHRVHNSIGNRRGRDTFQAINAYLSDHNLEVEDQKNEAKITFVRFNKQNIAMKAVVDTNIFILPIKWCGTP